jgi:hypothetical protein
VSYIMNRKAGVVLNRFRIYVNQNSKFVLLPVGNTCISVLTKTPFRCNEVFWTGLKFDPVGHFSTLNMETEGVEFRPWPVENWTAPWNFDNKPSSKFSSIKTRNTYSFGYLHFIPVFTFLFGLFCFWFILSQNPEKVLTLHSPNGFVFRLWKIKEEIKKVDTSSKVLKIYHYIYIHQVFSIIFPLDIDIVLSESIKCMFGWGN